MPCTTSAGPQAAPRISALLLRNNALPAGTTIRPAEARLVSTPRLEPTRIRLPKASPTNRYAEQQTGADIPGCNTQVIQCVNSAFIVLSQGSSAATTSASASASSSAAASSTSVSTAGAGTTLSTVSSAATTATSAGGAQTTTGAGSQATGAATTGKGSVSSTNGTTSGIVTTSGASSNGLGFFGAIAAVAAMVPFLA